MGGTTPNRSIRYPYASDPANAIAQYFYNMASDIDAAMGVLPGWTTITSLASGAVPTTGAYAPAYRLMPNGKVELRGGITAGSSFATGGVTLFTLPALSPTVYPSAIVLLPAATNYSSGYTTNSMWQISTTGQVSLFVAAGITSCSLDGIFYYTT